MTLPASDAGFTLEPAGLEALADELALLSAELAEDASAGRSAAAAFARALDGQAGWAAQATATAWASLDELLVDGTRAVAGTLRAAVAAYRAEDVALAAAVGDYGLVLR